MTQEYRELTYADLDRKYEKGGAGRLTQYINKVLDNPDTPSANRFVAMSYLEEHADRFNTPSEQQAYLEGRQAAKQKKKASGKRRSKPQTEGEFLDRLLGPRSKMTPVQRTRYVMAVVNSETASDDAKRAALSVMDRYRDKFASESEASAYVGPWDKYRMSSDEYSSMTPQKRSLFSTFIQSENPSKNAAIALKKMSDADDPAGRRAAAELVRDYPQFFWWNQSGLDNQKRE